MIKLTRSSIYLDPAIPLVTHWLVVRLENNPIQNATILGTVMLVPMRLKKKISALAATPFIPSAPPPTNPLLKEIFGMGEVKSL